PRARRNSSPRSTRTSPSSAQEETTTSATRSPRSSTATGPPARKSFEPIGMVPSRSRLTVIRSLSPPSLAGDCRCPESAHEATKCTKKGNRMLRLPSPLPEHLERDVHDTIGCCIDVHRVLGPGLLERIY